MNLPLNEVNKIRISRTLHCPLNRRRRSLSLTPLLSFVSLSIFLFAHGMSCNNASELYCSPAPDATLFPDFNYTLSYNSEFEGLNGNRYG